MASVPPLDARPVSMRWGVSALAVGDGALGFWAALRSVRHRNHKSCCAISPAR
jgi:hypothetical protein